MQEESFPFQLWRRKWGGKRNTPAIKGPYNGVEGCTDQTNGNGDLIEEESHQEDELTQEEAEEDIDEAGAACVLATECNRLALDSEVHRDSHGDGSRGEDESEDPHRKPGHVRLHLKDVLVYYERREVLGEVEVNDNGDSRINKQGGDVSDDKGSHLASVSGTSELGEDGLDVGVEHERVLEQAKDLEIVVSVRVE